MRTRITSFRDALLLLADDPGNVDYLDLYDAAAAVAIARTDREISEAEYRETIERIVARLRIMSSELGEILAQYQESSAAVVMSQNRLTAAETAQRIVEIRTGIGQ